MTSTDQAVTKRASRPESGGAGEPAAPAGVSWWRTTVDSAWAGVVGNLAWISAAAAAAFIVGALRFGEVPAWLLGATAIAVAVPLAFAYSARGRALERLRGELTEAQRRMNEQDAKVVALQLANGEPTISLRGQALLREIRALRQSGERLEAPPQIVELELLRALITEMDAAVGPNRTLLAASNKWRLFNDGNRHEYLATLDQLEAVATNFGIDDAQTGVR